MEAVQYEAFSMVCLSGGPSDYVWGWQVPNELCDLHQGRKARGTLQHVLPQLLQLYSQVLTGFKSKELGSINFTPGQDQRDFQWTSTSTLKRKTATVTSLLGKKLNNTYIATFSNQIPIQTTTCPQCASAVILSFSDAFPLREMPLPALYQMLSILFFLSGCFWVFILKKNGTEQVCL